MADKLLALVLAGKKTATISIILEGEDDSFEQWKLGHTHYWTRDAAKRGYTDPIPAMFERFEVVEVL